MGSRFACRRTAVGRAAVGAGLLLACGLAFVAGPARAVSATGTLAMTPDAPIVGEQVVARGRLSTHRARPIQLQQKTGSSWTTRITGRSASTGAFQLVVRAGAVPGSATYRVWAPKVRQQGHSYPAVRTPWSTLHAVGQTAALSVPATDLVGTEVVAAAAFTPARPGRLVQLQRQVSGSWTTVATSTEDGAGKAALAFTPSSAGSYSLRALAAPTNGAARAASATSTTAVTAPSKWRQLGASKGTFCGIQTDNTGWCWGRNDYNAAAAGGDNYEPWPVQLPGSWASLTTNNSVTCGLRTDGTGWCWGYNGDGEVGNGDSTTNAVWIPSELPGVWSKLYNFGGVTCGIRPDDTAWCWGSNYHGALGIGDPDNWRIYTPRQLPGHWSDLDSTSAVTSRSADRRDRLVLG